MIFLMEEIVSSTSLVKDGESSNLASFMSWLTLSGSGSIAIFGGSLAENQRRAELRRRRELKWVLVAGKERREG